MSRVLSTWLEGTLDNFKLRSGYNDHPDPQAYVRMRGVSPVGIQYGKGCPGQLYLDTMAWTASGPEIAPVWRPPRSGCLEFLSFSALAAVDLNCAVNVPSPDSPGAHGNSRRQNGSSHQQRWHSRADSLTATCRCHRAGALEVREAEVDSSIAMFETQHMAWSLFYSQTCCLL